MTFTSLVVFVATKGKRATIPTLMTECIGTSEICFTIMIIVRAEVIYFIVNDNKFEF